MTGHSLIKSAPITRVRPGIFEGSSAKLPNEAILLAISDDVRQMLPNRILLRPFGVKHPVSQRFGMVGAKQLPHLAGRKPARLVLDKQAKGCECPHQPIEKILISTNFCCDSIGLFRTIPGHVIKQRAPRQRKGSDCASVHKANQLRCRLLHSSLACHLTKTNLGPPRDRRQHQQRGLSTQGLAQGGPAGEQRPKHETSEASGLAFRLTRGERNVTFARNPGGERAGEAQCSWCHRPTFLERLAAQPYAPFTLR